eukprot:Skav209546  [mRNA]  locus=scaffold2497:166208:166981:+ [translate_table: standard]
MALAVAREAGYRSGSRSPRGKDALEADLRADKGVEEDFGGFHEEMKGGFSEQMKMQRDFLAQFMKPEISSNPTILPEAAAGLPLEAAQVLLLQAGPGPARPWQGRPAAVACLAAAHRLFARLLPGKVAETSCDDVCQAAGDIWTATQLIEVAQKSGLAARSVTSPVEVLDQMLKSRLSACCVLLDSYVGVLEESGEEVEQEVGTHCLLVVGGDLLGPTYVTFDPWGPSLGEVSLWQEHAVRSAGPVGFVQLTLAESS